jgi:Cyclic nucleotide-binding domain
MRIDGGATTISWIPSEAVSGIVYRVPFDVALAHYDDAPPDTLPDIEVYLAADGARFANALRAWIEVQDGEIVDFGHSGAGHLGSTTLRLGPRRLRFLAYPLRDLQRSERIAPDAVRFEQTAGGRTGVPAPRRVSHPPYVQFQAPLAWTTVALTLHADGRQEWGLAGASPFPRHWLYDAAGTLVQKSATVDYHSWSTSAFGRHSPWGELDSPAMVSEVETALERQLSVQIMRAGRKPELRRLRVQEHLVTQGEPGDDLFLVLDGVLRIDVDGQPIAQIGPGAIVGERSLLEQGHRTSSVIATTACLVAVADPSAISPEVLGELSLSHHREDPEQH